MWNFRFLIDKIMHLLFLSKILMVVKNALRLHLARIFKEKIKQDSCKAESPLL